MNIANGGNRGGRSRSCGCGGGRDNHSDGRGHSCGCGGGRDNHNDGGQGGDARNNNFNHNNGNRPVCQVCGKIGHVALKCYHCFDHCYQADDNRMAVVVSTNSYDIDTN